jgi:serine protease Do
MPPKQEGVMEVRMKKIGLIAGISFLAGVLFFALSFGYFQDNGSNHTALSPAVAQAQTNNSNQLLGKGFSFAPLVKKVKGAVVKVTSERIVQQRSSSRDDFMDRFFNNRGRNRDGGRKVSGTGTGFFITADGYILTNNHVVGNSLKIKITDIDGKEYTAKRVGTDPKTDLALLKIKGDNFPFIELGNSDRLEVGEWVLAIGNPLGQDLSVTSGIVSAKGRRLSGLEVDYQNFIQTDASINQGNSGGPLINLSGKAIGINSAILSTSGGSIGIGFAIPSNMATKVITDLKKEGRVIRGYMGVQIIEVSDSEAKQYDLPTGGVLVMKVEEGTPAKKAGLEKFDLIVAINGKTTKSSMALRTTIANHNPGETVTLSLYRDGKKKTIEIKVMEAPDSIAVGGSDRKGWL